MIDILSAYPAMIIIIDEQFPSFFNLKSAGGR